MVFNGDGDLAGVITHTGASGNDILHCTADSCGAEVVRVRGAVARKFPGGGVGWLCGLLEKAVAWS